MDDPIRLIEGVAIIAGKRLHATRDRARYERLALRIKTAARRGDIAASRDGRRTYYSRSDVEALKASYEAVGINGRAVPQMSKHIAARAIRLEADGLVNSASARALVGVSRSMPDYWGRQGWYGARMICREWYFLRDELPTKRRPPGRPPETVPCSVCGEPVERKASRIRETIARGGSFYCEDCNAQALAERLREARAVQVRGGVSVETRGNMSAAQARAWAEGKRDRDVQAAIARQVGSALRKSPRRHRAQVAAMMRTQHGTELSAERGKELERAARRRQQNGTAKVQESDKLAIEVGHLTDEGLTSTEIAERLIDEGIVHHITPEHVRRLRRKTGAKGRAGRPGRQPETVTDLPAAKP